MRGHGTQPLWQLEARPIGTQAVHRVIEVLAPRVHLVARALQKRLDEVMASVKRYPCAVLSTPGTSGYRLSYKRVLRVVPHKPLRSGIF